MLRPLALVVAALLQSGDLYNTDLYVDPAAGETASGGAVEVYHPGEGKPGAGYFMKHAPGEVAEFHLFVPAGLAPGRTYPLLIVYHGGKDGQSGKGFARTFGRISTKERPVFVLSPNMYTVDSFDELMQEGKHPIDPQRVLVVGFSSGGMGVGAAMRGAVADLRARPFGGYVMASTFGPFPEGFAETGRPVVVMAGENETPEHMKHPALKQRRDGCRKSAWSHRAKAHDLRYVEMQGEGHTASGPKHLAVIKQLLRGLGGERFHHVSKLGRGEEQPVEEAATQEDWTALRAELDRQEANPKRKAVARSVTRKIAAGLVKWFDREARPLIGLTATSTSLEKSRSLAVHAHLGALVKALEGHAWARKFERTWRKVLANKQLLRELDARTRWRAAVKLGDDAAVAALEELRAEMADTEYGKNRTRELVLASQP